LIAQFSFAKRDKAQVIFYTTKDLYHGHFNQLEVL